MFCARCGKQIEDDSTFCPFCGQQVDAPVISTGPAVKASSVISQGIKKSSALQGILSNKKVWGIALAFVAILGVGVGAVKLVGGKKSVPEKLLDMSWEDISDVYADDYAEILDKESILYIRKDLETNSDDYAYEYPEGVLAMSFEPFFGGDCFFGYNDVSHMSTYFAAYETSEDFKNGRKALDKYLDKEILKNAASFEVYDGMYSIYPVGKSEKDVDVYIDDVLRYGYKPYDWACRFSRVMEELNEQYTLSRAIGGQYDQNENESALREALSDCSIYKFVVVSYGDVDGALISDALTREVEDRLGYMLAPYTGGSISIRVIYVPLTEGQFTTLQVYSGWDSISGKKIDIDSLEGSFDEKFMMRVVEMAYKLGFNRGEVPAGDSQWNKSVNVEVPQWYEYGSDMTKGDMLFAILYMMDKHDFDMVSCSYLKTKEEKRLWYINNFGWDTDTQAPIDLSDYRDSSAIYCAVEFNYNPDKAEYFESELDKALYLADKNYKLGTGEEFGSDEEKRLWLLENYSYDISSGEVIDKEIVDALIAYQKYMDETLINVENYQFATENAARYMDLAYLDEDNIPELIIHTSLLISDEFYILSYHKGNVLEGYIYTNYGSISYAEKKNLFRMSDGRMGYYSDIFYSLSDGELKKVAEGLYGEKWEDGELITDAEGEVYEYSWNGVVCSEEEYSNSIDTFCTSQVGDAEWKTVDVYGDSTFSNVLSAYDALTTAE